MKIAVVDDEPIILKLISRSLHKDGHHVKAYDSGVDFLDNYNHYLQYDIILLDVMMPGKTGLEVFDELFAKFEEKPIIIFISAFDFSGKLSRYLEYPNVDYLPKPFTIRELRRILSKFESNFFKSESPIESQSSSQEIKL
ncbi:MAG: response regulator [Deltaproteobacteria bacterium]|jgi:CheY-like chemotaxis protein|nr:response regulator [Deltaproteobacteria bacterium]